MTVVVPKDTKKLLIDSLIMGLATVIQSSGSVQILSGSNASVLTPVSDLNKGICYRVIEVLKSLYSTHATCTLNAWIGTECGSALSEGHHNCWEPTGSHRS